MSNARISSEKNDNDIDGLVEHLIRQEIAGLRRERHKKQVNETSRQAQGKNRDEGPEQDNS